MKRTNTEKTVSFWPVPSYERLRLGEQSARQGHGGELRFSSVKGAHASLQLVVQCDVPVTEISLAAEDLKNGIGEIPAAAFEIYVEKFVRTAASKRSDCWPEDFYGDSHNPQEMYFKKYWYAEQIYAFWITLNASAAFIAGDYSGKFALTVNGAVQAVPVSVKLYDYSLPDRSTNPTAFGYFWYDGSLMTGVEDKAKFAFIKACDDLALQYRLNTYWIFPKEGYLPSGEEYASYIDERFDHPHFVVSCLPVHGSVLYTEKIDGYRQYLFALAERSRPGRNLLSCIYTYFYDEPEGNYCVPEAEYGLFYYEKMLGEVADAIGNDESGRYGEFKKIAGWRESILGLPTVGTIDLSYTTSTVLIEKSQILCPIFMHFNNAQTYKNGNALVEKMHKTLWWYGCNGPWYPHPSTHIPDALLGLRLTPWMQKHYGAQGWLYWSIAGYLWDPHVFENGQVDDVPGDGFLIYPSHEFGGFEPFPSVRLMNIREGLEEYEMLRILEERMPPEPLFAGLFEDVIVYDDGEKFAERRETLFRLLAGECKEMPPLCEKTVHVLEEVPRETVLREVRVEGGREIPKYPGVIPVPLLCLTWPMRQALPMELGIFAQFEFSTPENAAEIRIPLAMFGKERFEGLKRITFAIYNSESRALEMQINLRGKSGEFQCQGNILCDNRAERVLIEWERHIVGRFDAEEVVIKLYNYFPEKDKDEKRVAVVINDLCFRY